MGTERSFAAIGFALIHAGEVVPVPVRRIHAVLHDADPTRWGSPPPPDRFTDRHDAIADRINAVDWNMGR
jgi:hypothetical protein